MTRPPAEKIRFLFLVIGICLSMGTGLVSSGIVSSHWVSPPAQPAGGTPTATNTATATATNTPTASPTPRALGHYPATTIDLSDNGTVTPDAAPSGITNITITTSSDFLGTLTADVATGVIRVTNAQPAGTYSVIVHGYGPGIIAGTSFQLTVWTTQACESILFANTATLPLERTPEKVAIGDLNGDGIQDLATANSNGNRISVMLGNGAGGFAAPTDYATNFPISIAIADLDGDGHQDLIAANYLASTASTFRGNGDGTFQTPITYSTGSGPFSAIATDLNGDGIPDLIVADQAAGDVSVRLGSGGGNFGQANIFAVGAAPQSIFAGDFNGDGHADLVTANQNGQNVSVLINTGTGSFSTAVNLTAGMNPVWATVGDLNSDHIDDLIVCNEGSANISVLLGLGNGGFGSPSNFGVGQMPYFVAIGDLNGDGNQDLAVANAGSDSVSILTGNGSGSLSSPIAFSVGDYPRGLAVGDFNGDGKQDLAVANLMSNSVSILTRTCGATPTSTPTNTPTATATATTTPTGSPACTPVLYEIAQIGGSIVPGTTNIGSNCDDCVTAVTLPFPFTLYDTSYASVNVGSNGDALFGTADPNIYTVHCIPVNGNSGPLNYTIFADYGDHRTDANPGCSVFPGSNCGIFTSVTGSAPNRIFNIEWRTAYFDFPAQSANFELRLYEGQTRFDVIYGSLDLGNTASTAGVQQSLTNFSQFFCDGAGGAATGGQSYTLQGCATPTATATATMTASTTATPTGTPSCTPANVINDGGFENGGIPSTIWDHPQTSTNFGSPLCTFEFCGNGGGTSLPRSGLVWAWFGGASAVETATLGQDVVIPTGTAQLHFWMRIGTVSDPFTDVLNVKIDNVTVISYPEPSVAESAYTERIIDLTPYANGASHNVQFEYIGPTTGTGNFTVDDVSLLLGGACATLSPTPTFTPTPTASPSPTSTHVATDTPTSTPTASPSCTPSWVAGPDWNPPAGGTRAVGVYFPTNGRFYAVGGRSSDVAGNNFVHPFEYDPAANHWTEKSAAFPDINVNNMACGVLTVDSRPQIFCVGGSAGGGTTATARVFAYDPINDTIIGLNSVDDWPGNPPSPGNILPGGFAVLNNKLYTIGAFLISPATMLGDVWAFDPSQPIGSRWTLKAGLPVEKGYVPATAIGGFIYTAGGAIINGMTLDDSTEAFKYDPVADSWTVITRIPRPVGETRALNINGKMWVLGGGRTAPNPSNEVDIYDPATDTWSVGPPFVNGRRNFPADTDGDHIWLTGGYDVNNTIQPSMEIFGVCITPSPTPTLTSTSTGTPSPLPTHTATATATASATGSPVCTPTRYNIAQIGGSIDPGTTNIGNNCDDCATLIALPFVFTLYDASYDIVNIGSNGDALFGTADPNIYSTHCIPVNGNFGPLNYTIFADYGDHRTDANPGCSVFPGSTCGIFTSVTGSAPNRIFNIEWRTAYFDNPNQHANFELRLYEGQNRFDVIYGTLDMGNLASSAGVQQSLTNFDQYFCDGSGGAATGGQSYSYVLQSCVTPTATATFTPTPTPTPRRVVRADFDGDGRTDLSVFRPSEGSWYFNNSTTGLHGVQFGISTDIPVPGDYDGDGTTDVAVYRPGGYWYRINSNSGFPEVFNAYGAVPPYIPQRGDVNRVGRDEAVAFNTETGDWYFYIFTSGTIRRHFGLPSDKPCADDYNGDGLVDLCVFREGTWYRANLDLSDPYGEQFGLPGDLPVPADYDGDNKADFAVFRPSSGDWYFHFSSDGSYGGFHWGQNGDVPVPGDYDGDGRNDIAVYRGGIWYIYPSGGVPPYGVQFGLSSDIPIPSKYIQ